MTLVPSSRINRREPVPRTCYHDRRSGTAWNSLRPLRINRVASNLKHPRFVRSGSDSCNVHNAIGKTDHEQQVVSDQAPAPPYFYRFKKSLAASTFQCVLRKVDHRVRLLRSGDRSMPLRFNTLAIVPRPTL